MVTVTVTNLAQAWSQTILSWTNPIQETAWDCCSRGGGGGGRPDQVDWRATGFAFLFPRHRRITLWVGHWHHIRRAHLHNGPKHVRRGLVCARLVPAGDGREHLARGCATRIRGGGKVGDEFGSKKELQLAALFYGAGAIVQGLAPSLGVLIMGRFTYGLGIGLAIRRTDVHRGDRAAVCPGIAYIPQEGFIVGGIMLGYLGSYVIFGQDEGVEGLLSTPAVPAAVLMFGHVSPARLSALASAARSPRLRGEGSTRAGTRQEGQQRHRGCGDGPDGILRPPCRRHQRAVQAREPAAPVHRHLRRALPADNRSTQRVVLCRAGIHQRRIRPSGWCGRRCHPWFLQAPDDWCRGGVCGLCRATAVATRRRRHFDTFRVDACGLQ